ncbi:transmembrane protein 218 isoform X1 [Synchiropus splendidus]|uniref:transmembrane protein 218 isoform X1 n=1 Tax=Synchiropus splendidus TaxID=270530 RepID=UPI00237DC6E0|nr:transmembrane protein 218 isoform X1 [Synchiropus splendidus]
MANTVLEVGNGVFILAVVWIAALVVGAMLLRASGSSKFAVIPVFLLALIITLVLVFFPRSPEIPPAFNEIEIVDTLFIGRYVLLAVCAPKGGPLLRWCGTDKHVSCHSFWAVTRALSF